MRTFVGIRALHVAMIGALAAGSWSATTWAANSAGTSPVDAPLTSKSGLDPVESGVVSRAGSPAWLYKSKDFELAANAAGGGKVTCGRTGYRAVGGGVQTPTLREALNESRPWDSPRGDELPDNGWIGYVINPASEPIVFRVYVICHQ